MYKLFLLLLLNACPMNLTVSILKTAFGTQEAIVLEDTVWRKNRFNRVYVEKLGGVPDSTGRLPEADLQAERATL